MRGKLYVFEGMSGAGKDTMADFFAERLRLNGREVIRLNLPARIVSPFGRLLNAHLDVGWPKPPARFDEEHEEYCALLFGALYQCEHMFMGTHIQILLDEGKDVVVVRYTLSTLVYQRDVKPLHPLIRAVSAFMPRPTATFFVDCTPETTIKRKEERPGNTTEWYDRKVEEIAALRAGYLAVLAPAVSQGIVLVFGLPVRANSVLGTFVPLDGDLDLHEAYAQLVSKAKKKGLIPNE